MIKYPGPGKGFGDMPKRLRMVTNDGEMLGSAWSGDSAKMVCGIHFPLSDWWREWMG